ILNQLFDTVGLFYLPSLFHHGFTLIMFLYFFSAPKVSVTPIVSYDFFDLIYLYSHSS
uniref:Uncharacterized protein n=1 Tax=Prolemur simus TaxID=1328070 RepID=A0A8C8YSG8_PROSS